MKILYVHERFGALAGAEANAFITAQELSSRGHHTAILHGPGTGKNEDGWSKVFHERFALDGDTAAQTRAALTAFRPDAVYVHKMADLEVIQTLVDKQSEVVLCGVSHDLLVRDGALGSEGRLRLKERIVVMDSEMVPNSLIYPA